MKSATRAVARDALGRAWPWLLLGLLAWMTFPGEYSTRLTGLDPSWIAGLNLFHRQGVIFGRDLIFTYGPLGFLDRPLEIGSNLVLASWFRVLVHLGGLAVVAMLIGRRSTHWLGAVSLGWVAVVALGPELDYQLLALAFLLSALALEEEVVWPWLIIGPLSGLLLFIKFGSGICALGQLGAALLLWSIRRKEWRTPAIAGAAYAVFVVGLGASLLGSTEHARDFVARSLEIATGYNAAMSIAGGDAPLVVALVLVAALATVTVCARPSDPGFSRVAVLGAVPVAYSIKHGFLRQDPRHEMVPFGVVAMVLLVGLMFSRRRWVVAISLTLVAGCVLGYGWQLPAEERRMFEERVASLVSFQTGSTNLDRFLHLGRTRAELREHAGALLEPDRIPADWLTTLGRSSVLVVPWEISICWANELACLPYPTLQMYSTYTVGLDHWTANRLRDLQPEFVIASVEAIDERNMVWDCPETWAALLQGYKPLGEDPQGRLLLRRRPVPHHWEEKGGGRLEGRFGEWVELPDRAVPARVAVDLRPSLAGRLRSLLLRPDPIELEVRGDGGEVRAYRLVVDTARNGLLIDALPTNISELADLFDCCTVGFRVTALRIGSDAARTMRPEYAVRWTWLETERGLRSRPRPPLTDAKEGQGKAMAWVDRIDGKPVSPGRPVRIDPSAAAVWVEGWAADPESRSSAAAVYLEFDGRLRVLAEYGRSREDVATALGVPGYARTGFGGGVAVERLGKGRHQLRLRIVSASGTQVWSTDPIPIDVQ